MWHEEQLYKLHTFLPDNIYKILQSYLTNRYFKAKYREAYSSFRQILAGVPQGNVLGHLLYLIYTADLPTLANSTTATFADDTAMLTVHGDSTMAAQKLQMHLKKIQSWLKTWRMKANEAKSVQVTFTLSKMTCPPVKLNNDHLSQEDEVKYLGIHLDRRLAWRKHITIKRKQLDLKLRNLYWIIGRQSQLLHFPISLSSLKFPFLLYQLINKLVRRGWRIRSWWGNRRERDHWGDLGVDGWIILRWVSRRWDVGMWTGLVWPRIETGGVRL